MVIRVPPSVAAHNVISVARTDPAAHMPSVNERRA
jgi:hypothetical protein